MKHLFDLFKISLSGLWIGIMALGLTPAFAGNPKAWEESISLEKKERYIPVELWAGADWDGTKDLKMPPVDVSYKHRHGQTR